MKRLLVLGIGPSQVDLIVEAKKLGVEVFACAANENGPGRQLVSGFKQIDIKNYHEVEKYAREIKADAIYSVGLELAIKTIAIVSNRLKLPCFYSIESLQKMDNKASWRKELTNFKNKVDFISGNTPDDFRKWDKFPAIMKPVDGSGQRGVIKVLSYDDIILNFDDVVYHSLVKEVIIEEYIEGPEISINTFMMDGELKFAIVSDRISYSEYPGGIIKEHHIPSQFCNDSGQIAAIELAKNVNEVFGLNGQIYFQMKVENGVPKLIEFMPRFDGCHMWRLIYESTGFNLLKATIELLLFNSSPTFEEYKFENLKTVKTVKTVFISDKPNTIVEKNNYNLPKNLKHLEWYYEDGDKVKQVTGYMEKMGYYIVG